MCTCIDHCDGTTEELETLLANEVLRAAHQFDATMIAKGQQPYLHKEIQRRTIEVTDQITNEDPEAEITIREVIYIIFEAFITEQDDYEVLCGKGSKLLLLPMAFEEEESPQDNRRNNSNNKQSFSNNKHSKSRHKTNSSRILMGNSGTITSYNNDEEDELEDQHAQHDDDEAELEVLKRFTENVYYGGVTNSASAERLGIPIEQLKQHEELAIHAWKVAEADNQRKVSEEDTRLEQVRLQAMEQQSKEEQLTNSVKRAAQVAVRQMLVDVAKDKDRQATNQLEEYNPFDHLEDYNDTNPSGIMINSSYKQNIHNQAQQALGLLPSRTQFPHRNTNNTYQGRPQYHGPPRPQQPPPDHCSTCGQHNTDCTSLGFYKDSQGNTQCFLKDQPLCAKLNVQITSLDQLKRASLQPQQIDKILTSAARYGCLQGISQPDFEELKSKFPKYKESIGQSLGTVAKSGTV
jgi:hypothetical protein